MDEKRHKFMFKSQIDDLHQAYIEKQGSDIAVDAVGTILLTSACALLWYTGLSSVTKDVVDATVLLGSAGIATAADVKQIENFVERIKKYGEELKYYNSVRSRK